MVFQDPMTSLNPVLQGRLPARRGDQDAPPEGARRRRQGARDRAPAHRRRAEPGDALRPVPARVLGRHAAARDDRDVDRELAVPADRRRADDRARRDDPGAGARGDEARAGGDARGHDPDHPRPRHRRRAVRAGARHVRAAGSSSRATSTRSSSSRGIRTRSGSWTACRASTEDEEWLHPIPGQPPSLINRPTGCAFHPRCFLSQGRAACLDEVPEPAQDRRHRARDGLPLRRGAARPAVPLRAARRGRRCAVSAERVPARPTVDGGRSTSAPPRGRRSCAIDGPRQALPDPGRAPQAHGRPDPRGRRRRPRRQRGRDARPRRRVRLRQDDARADAHQADRADRAGRSSSTAATSRASRGGRCATCAARCRSSSRTRTRRSTRG